MIENTRGDKELGMGRKISRRDFVNGAAVVVGAAVPTKLLAQQSNLSGVFNSKKGADPSAEGPLLAQGISETDPRYYPPALTGMRGSHPGSFEAAHALRDGTDFGGAVDTKERYDLIVVGGGISGLSSAYMFRDSAGSDAKTLLLDNHDDFGGHAKRNEFTYNNRTLLLNGGTSNLEAIDQYSTVSRTLLKAIGVDFERLAKASNTTGEFYNSLKLGSATFFSKEVFGTDRLVQGSPPRGSYTGKSSELTEWLSKTPLSAEVQHDLVRLYSEERDYWPDLSQAEKVQRLARTSYKDFLLNIAKVSADSIPFLAQYGADLTDFLYHS